MICADAVSASGVTTWQAAASQPADLSACAVVMLTGADTGALAAFAFPTGTDAAAAWGFGFVLVVTCYVLGWYAGAVLGMIPRR